MCSEAAINNEICLNDEANPPDCVGKFVLVKASDFNKSQQLSTSG
jgi:hypothetical protein